MGIRAMLYLIFAFLVLLLLSFIPSVRNLFASWFVSNQFKAIRFVLTTFGIIGLILGLLNWYMVKTPLALTEKTSFELLIKRELPFFEASKEKRYLYKTENDVLSDPFHQYFSGGWRPVVTEIKKNTLTEIRSFREDKGAFLTKEELDAALAPNKTIANLGHGFYIPPGATFKVNREIIEDRLWTYMTIENNRIFLQLKLTGLINISYVEMVYKKKGLLNYIFYDYSKYNEWFNFISTRIKEKQLTNQFLRGFSEASKNK